MEKTQHPEGEVAPLDGFIGIQRGQTRISDGSEIRDQLTS